ELPFYAVDPGSAVERADGRPGVGDRQRVLVRRDPHTSPEDLALQLQRQERPLSRNGGGGPGGAAPLTVQAKLLASVMERGTPFPRTGSPFRSHSPKMPIGA